MRLVRVAAIQMTSGADVSANEESIFTLVERAADEGARYIQLPEYATYWGPLSGYADAAKSLDDGFLRQLGLLARGRGVVVHVGSLLEPAAEWKFYNTSVVIGEDGQIRGVYRKVHLFDAHPPGGGAYRESEVIVPGEGVRLVDVAGTRVGLSVCFDVRFAELYRSLALAGARVVAVPAAFSARTGPAHWEVLVRSRAIENHVFVVAAAQAGTTAEGLATHGHSLIVDPWGEVLVEASGEGTDVLVANLDLSHVDERRSQIDVLALRRPDVYAAMSVVDAGPETAP